MPLWIFGDKFWLHFLPIIPFSRIDFARRWEKKSVESVYISNFGERCSKCFLSIDQKICSMPEKQYLTHKHAYLQCTFSLVHRGIEKRTREKEIISKSVDKMSSPIQHFQDSKQIRSNHGAKGYMYIYDVSFLLQSNGQSSLVIIVLNPNFSLEKNNIGNQRAACKKRVDISCLPFFFLAEAHGDEQCTNDRAGPKICL